MEQPNKILDAGTKVLTNDTLESTDGIVVAQRFLDARRPSVRGTILNTVPGHGGDVYWVQHSPEGNVAPYCFTEFHLAEKL